MIRQHKHKFAVELPHQFDNLGFIRELQDSIPDSVKGTYLRQELLSKYNGPGTASAVERRTAAIVKWQKIERNNAKTNQRLLLGGDLGWTSSDLFFEHVRKVTGKILGQLVYPDVLTNSVHTNGASVGVKRGPLAALTKLGQESLISMSGVKHWLAAFSGTLLSSQTLVPTESSQLFTVPKNSEIDRVAAKEPSGNMLLQRSVGMHIARRLRRFGVDLRDQRVNQRLSGEAVKRGLATIDLSAASDSITHQLVIQCLPFDWYWLLDDLRVKSTLVDGHLHELEMFSSMGNGFTFELESLLFYAITRVCLELSNLKGIVSVYGDDIIAPCAVVPRLRRLLAFLGFKMNPKKTNYKGLYRESCGAHWWNGYDIRPFYIRRPVTTVLDLMNILNRVFHWDSNGNCDFFFTEELAMFHLKYREFVPKVLWGGTSTDDPTSLVTGHRPRKRLVPITTACSISQPSMQSSAYLYWQLARSRVSLPLEVKPRREVAYKVVRHSCSFGALVTNPYLILGRDEY
ncbi:TPA_asm: RNA-directed RNA polymerase [ssRNA phage SRR7976323_2]|uniref:RNA-directed RNA polymerase n=1 Tax=ssRNA phage SRR7976323_2 TaxID=2786689 RepID=A0A8S5L4W3_9VIRU|nr:RNA-directed RNA polymerase [ssRNA phage SRR7976323_2]DAD52736.1 TPA_asm: RNA-directed RNA polymerase [ssRNA phage SRR7976323_2]